VEVTLVIAPPPPLTSGNAGWHAEREMQQKIEMKINLQAMHVKCLETISMRRRRLC